MKESERSASLRWLYAGLFYAFGVQVPFVSLWLRAHGFDAQQIGLVFAVFPLVRVTIPLVTGYLADIGVGGLSILRFFTVLSLVGGVLLYAAPSTSFAWIFAALSLLAVGRAPLVPLSDSLVLSLHTDASVFGRLRFAGSLSFLIAAICCGAAYDAGLPNAFLVQLLFGLLLAFFSTYWVAPFAVKTARARLEDILVLVKQRSFLYFLCAAFVGKAAEGPFDVFLGPRLAESSSHWLFVAAAWAAAVVPEILVFVYGGALLSRLRLRDVLPCLLLVASVRWWFLGWVVSPVALLCLQPLHALTFAAYYLLSVSYVARVAGPAVLHSAQAIFGVVTYGLGGIVGAQLAGWFVSQYSVHKAFFAASVASLLAAILMFSALRERSGLEK